MKTKKQILAFIESQAEKYSIKLQLFFPQEKIDDEDFDINAINLSEENITKLSIIFGCEKDDIYNTNTKAVEKWLARYPYFDGYRDYRFIIELPYGEEAKILSAIFGEKYEMTTKIPFDPKDVNDRLMNLLQKIDKCMPGTIHMDARIQDLVVSCYSMKSYPEIGKLVRDYLIVYYRYKDLFFQAIKGKLAKEEIQEYNVLAAHFLAVDIIKTSEYMFYDYIERNRDMLVAENYNELFSYVRLRRDDFRGFQPFECIEFYDNISQIKEYIKVFPRTKKLMKEYLEKISNFICTFVWSDDPYETLEDNFFLDDDYEGPIKIPKKEQVNVKKSVNELGEAANAVSILEKLCRVPSAGGLAIEHSAEFDIRLHDWSEKMNEIQYIMERMEFRDSFKNA